MGRERRYVVTWTPRAVRQLAALLNDSRHGKKNLEWRKRKASTCRGEAERRLEVFPNLRDRYVVDGVLCNAITLRSFPAQIMYREGEEGTIVIFFCRWAQQDTTGPQDFNED